MLSFVNVVALQALRSELSQYLCELAVPPSLVAHIVSTAASEREFLEQLHELQHKLQFQREQAFHERRAATELAPVLEALKEKVLLHPITINCG